MRDRLDVRRPDWVLLDVRGADEVARAHIPGSRHIYLGELPERLDALDRACHHTVMCGSGTRATIGASILLRAGFSGVGGASGRPSGEQPLDWKYSVRAFFGQEMVP